jgi:sortase A
MGWRVAESWGNISSEWETPEHEAGWHRNSARPGEGGNIVISGHNNSIGVGVFGALEQLAAGDPIILHAGADAVYLYRVKETHIVRAFAPTQETVDFLTAAIAPTPHEQLTLITCWPSWSNTHRLVVIAEPASPP